MATSPVEGGISRVDFLVFGVCTMSFVWPSPRGMRQTVCWIVRMPFLRSKSLHFKPAYFPDTQAKFHLQEHPDFFLGVGGSRRNDRRAACSAGLRGRGSAFSVVEASHRVQEAASDGGVPHICRYASTSKDSCAEDVPNGLWLLSLGDKICRKSRSKVDSFSSETGRSPKTGSRYLCRVY